LRHLVLYPASGRFDFLPSASACLDSAHGHALCGVSIREKLGWALSLTDQSRFGQSLLRHFSALRQSGKIVEPDDLVLYTKDIRETTLGDAASERHLPALELGLAAAGAVMATARLDTLVALARCLTGAGARTASESLAIPMRSRGRNQIVQADSLDLCLCLCLGSHSLSLYRRHFDEVTHVLDLSAQRG
jgi:hypothetical protein